MQKILKIIRESLDGEEREYTSGSINRAIVLLSIPMVLEMVMESLFAVVDVYFVSKVSVDAVAVVGLTESLLTLIYSIAIGMSMAATAMVARRIGEKKAEAASVAAMQAVLIAVVLSILIGVPGLLFASDILRFMGGSDTMIASGASYTRIALSSNMVIMLLFLLNGIFRGAGNAAIAMRALWIANGINIVLDPLFIFGIGPFPEMGVTGAAVATLIGRSIGVMYQIYNLLGTQSKKSNGSIIRFTRKHLEPQWDIIRRLLKVGITGAGQFLIASASWIFLVRIIAKFGSDAVAGYTIAIRVIIFSTLPSWGIANAAATLVGQNLGAGQPHRAEVSVWRSGFFNMIFLVLLSLILVVCSAPVIRFFTSDPAAVEAGIISLRIFCAGYIFWAWGMVISQAFNGAGDTRTPTFINLICFWAMEIPLGYLLAVTFGWGVAGVCAAVAISESAWAIISLLVFRRGKWKTVKI
ncbi:MAG TPA: MATE family efflux transporter [Saprospiraceae bacterium]|nr:MATE family efflux transporter [Saprospiraceae bacterium]HMP13853.1 MATE family efflux transporter [Saprospiraceae bacterium]